MTPQELQAAKQKILSQPPAGRDLSSVKTELLKQAPQNAPQPDSPHRGIMDIASDVVVGAGKGIGSTVSGLESLGEKLITRPIDKAVSFITGKKGPLPVSGPTEGEKIQENYLQPTTTAQKVGKGAEQLAEFLIPGEAPAKAAKALEAASGLSKATGLAKAAKILPRAATEAATFAGQTAIQSGGDAGEIKTAAVTGAALPVVGKALGMAGKQVAKAAGGTAERLINSLIKPLQRDFAYGKNPGRGVANEGIVANSFEDLIGKVTEKRQELGQAIGTALKGSPGKSVSTLGIFAPIQEAITKASNAPRSNASLITRLENLMADLKVKKKILTPEEAFDLKQKVAELTSFTGNPTDDKMVNSALKRVYGAIKERINKAVPAVKELNERFADIKSAEVAAKYREKIMERQNILPFSAKAAGGVTGALMGGAPGAALGVLLSAGAEKILGSTLLKTRVANLLAKLGKAELEQVLKAYPFLRPLIERMK